MALTLSGANALFKEVYSKRKNDIIPDCNILYKELVKVDPQKLGYNAQYFVPLTREWGFTFGASGANTTLNDVVDATYGRAVVVGTEITMRGQITYGAVASSQTEEAAFMEASSVQVSNLLRTHGLLIEHSAMRGHGYISAIGTVAASGTSCTFVVSLANSALGLMNQLVGCRCDIFHLTSDASPVNTNAAVSITSVAPQTNGTINFTATISSSDAAALDGMSGDTGFLYFYKAKTGASTYSTPLGLLEMCQASTIFNIATSGNPLWTPINYDVQSNPFSLSVLDDALGQAVGNGLEDGGVVLLNPRVFATLNSLSQGKRMLDQSYDKNTFTTGTKGIMVMTQVGPVELRPHMYMPVQEAVFFVPKFASFRGPRGLEFGVPGSNPNEPLFHIQDKTSFEYRTYSNIALYYSKPGTAIRWYNIDLT